MREKLAIDLKGGTWTRRVVRVMRKLVRKSGFDVVKFPDELNGAGDIAHLLELKGINVLFDIGANVGQYARQIRRSGYQGRIVSFEPVKDTHNILTRIAAGDGAWTVAPRMALGEDEKETDVYVSSYSDMSSLLQPSRATRIAFPRANSKASESVRERKLDNVFSDYVVGGELCFVKIDTQGFERRILEGARGVMPSIHGLQLELSLVSLYEGETLFAELHEYVCSIGFEPYLFLPGYYSRLIGRQLQVDCVYFRNSTSC